MVLNETILNYIKDNDLADVKPDYSGRYMFGETTIGLVCSNIVDVVIEINESDLSSTDKRIFNREISSCRKDEFGKYDTVYY